MSHPSDSITLSVIIPVYNENVFLRELLRRVIASPISKEIILIDDCSTDGTREQIRTLEKDSSGLTAHASAPTTFRFLYHETNQGKGAAIRTGLAAATGLISVIQDADLEYNPEDYPKLIAPILAGNADVVYGSRFRGETIRVHYFWHALGNKTLTLVSNLCTGLMLSDMETCYKVFLTKIVQSIPIRCNRFGFEPEITAKIAKLKCRIYEVPISYSGRTYDEGKKITWWDGIKAILTILRFWLVDDLYDTHTAGRRTLRIMEGAGDYNRWLYERCKDFLGRNVLEVGSGVGNMTKFLLDRDSLVATDSDLSYVSELMTKYGHFQNVRVSPMDAANATSVRSAFAFSKVDCVLSMNVLEHIEDDGLSLRLMYDALPKGGKLVLLVPAHPVLYSAMDRNISHFRRYSRVGLTSLLSETGFKVNQIRYVNWLGAIGWFINGRILRRQLVPSRQLRLFDWLTFLLLIERWVALPFGLSLLAVAEKPS